MLPLLIRVFFFALVLSFSYVSGHDRKIISKLNPGCVSCSTDETLIYIEAEGSSDIIHQIWDFTQGIPTIIFAIGSLNSTLRIDWDGLMPKDFVFNEKPKYSFAIVLDKIYEYNDLEDNAKIDPRVDQRGYSLQSARWTLTNSRLTEEEVMAELASTGLVDGHSGLVKVKLDLLPFKDFAVDLPHLIHTANSTLVDLSLVGLPTRAEYNASRFAWHMTLASTDPAMDTMYSTVRRSLDDEHTPGVFEVVEITTPESHSNGDGGFLQLRPVAYRRSERNVGTSTNAHVGDLTRADLPRHSTVGNFYRSFDKSNLLIEDLFVSFGEPGDGFYKQNNYTAWSLTAGYGAPPVEGFSLFVIVIIAVGLGVPVALAASAVAYACARRRNSHRRFEDH